MLANFETQCQALEGKAAPRCLGLRFTASAGYRMEG